LVFFATFIQIAVGASPEPDFVAMYQDFFKDLKGKQYQKVWGALALGSRKSIAKEIADAALSMGKITTEAQVYDMLERNESNFRTAFFDGRIAEWEKVSFWTELNTAKLSLKSSTRERAILTIMLKNDPKDFQIIREEGRWKVNFFDDLSR